MMNREQLMIVLMYVFQHYASCVNTQSHLKNRIPSIVKDMEQLGFPGYAIESGVKWFSELEQLHKTQPMFMSPSQDSVRVLSSDEVRVIEPEVMAYLAHVEKLGILDVASREMVLNRLMALRLETIHLPEAKWVVLMVLFHQPEKYQQLRLLEEMSANDKSNAH